MWYNERHKNEIIWPLAWLIESYEGLISETGKGCTVDYGVVTKWFYMFPCQIKLKNIELLLHNDI